mmetsp:Transcript_64882/g.156812  ORF Transcript_64882/g.156812 Transcript_64882/m.156812 type:complete len:259 (-) Transcript_64882:647-1423(-)
MGAGHSHIRLRRPCCFGVDEPPVSALIWMHGLGDTDMEWTRVLRQQVLPHLEAVAGPCKLVAPLAPIAPVTCNRGRCMTRWFDMAELPIGAGHAPPRFGCSLSDAQASAKRIHGIIDQLCKQGIPAEKIVVGGFSQGGALAMLSALQYHQRLACCIAFSGLLLGLDQLEQNIHPVNRDLEVLWCHGEHDLLVLPSMQRVGCEALKQAGVQVHRRRYPAGHKTHPAAIAEAADFIAERFAEDADYQYSEKQGLLQSAAW